LAKKFDLKKLGVSALLGLSAAFTFYSHFQHQITATTMRQAFAFMAMSILFTATSYFFLLRFVFPYLASLSLRTRLTSLGISLLAGAFLITAIPFQPPGKIHHLEIIAEGEKNPQSLGTEIHFVGLVRNENNLRVDPKGFLREGLWKETSRGLVTSQKSAALRWNGRFDREADLGLIFKTNIWSGIAKIVWDGHPQSIDLYAEFGMGGQITVPLLARNETGFLRSALFAFHAVTLGFIMLTAAIWLTTRPSSKNEPVKLTSWTWTRYFIPCFLVFSVYLFAFWPGIMSYDSYVQWKEAVDFRLTNYNPFFHTLHIWLFTRIWQSPAAITLLQVLLMSVLVSWGCMVLHRLNVPKSVIWAACILVLLSPYNGFLVVTLWKDIFYGMSFFALTLILVKIVFSDGQWLERWSSPFILGVVAALVALYRHNGFPAAFGTLALLPFVYRRYWRNLIMALTISLAFWLLVIGPLASALGVTLTDNKKQASSFILTKIAAHINAGTEMTDDENDFLSQIPYFIEASRSPLFTCSSFRLIDEYINSKTGLWLRDFPACKQTGKLMRILLAFTVRNPLVTLKSQLCASSWAWRVFEDYSHLYYWGPIAPLKISKRIVSTLPKAEKYDQLQNMTDPWREKFKGFFSALKKDLYQSNFIRPFALKATPYLYLFFFSLVICALKQRSWKVLVIFAPAALHTITIILLVKHTAFRYQWPVHLVGLFLFLPFAFIQKRPHESAET
jgi:hypothetical protein